MFVWLIGYGSQPFCYLFNKRMNVITKFLNVIPGEVENVEFEVRVARIRIHPQIQRFGHRMDFLSKYDERSRDRFSGHSAGFASLSNLVRILTLTSDRKHETSTIGFSLIGSFRIRSTQESRSTIGGIDRACYGERTCTLCNLIISTNATPRTYNIRTLVL